MGTLMGHNISTYHRTESRSFMLKLVTDAQVKPQRCDNLLEEKTLSIKENSVTITVEPFAIRCLVLSR